MALNPVPTELTTAATDALLAILCVMALVVIRRRQSVDPWKVGLWSWLLGLLALASVLGAIAHGLELTDRFQDLLWQPLYLCLGLVVALFTVAAIRDRFGEPAARRSLPWMIVFGFGFFRRECYRDRPFDGIRQSLLCYDSRRHQNGRRPRVDRDALRDGTGRAVFQREHRT